MRTTITLDDDVVAGIEARRAATGESFREAVNGLLRRGLRHHKAAEAPPLPMLNGRPTIDVTDVSGVLGQLDDDRTLERRVP